MATNKKQHLDCVLKSHNIENNETLIKNYRAKRDEVKNELLEKYKGERSDSVSLYHTMAAPSLKGQVRRNTIPNAG